MKILFYALALVTGYLIGSSNMAYYIQKIKGTDIAGQGSKNLGTCNTFSVVGVRASILVLVHDLGKAVLAVLIGRFLYTPAEYAGVAAGVACIFGHVFPFYLRFRGGKGYASYLGLMLSLDWKYTLIAFAVTAAVTMITNYIIIGNLTTVVPFPVYLAVIGNYVAAAIVAIASVLIIYKHRSHLKDLARGKESKFWDDFLKKDKRKTQE